MHVYGYVALLLRSDVGRYFSVISFATPPGTSRRGTFFFGMFTVAEIFGPKGANLHVQEGRLGYQYV